MNKLIWFTDHVPTAFTDHIPTAFTDHVPTRSTFKLRVCFDWFTVEQSDVKVNPFAEATVLFDWSSCCWVTSGGLLPGHVSTLGPSL